MKREGQDARPKNGFSYWLKNIFFLLLILQFVPIIFSSMKTQLEDAISPKEKVGYLTIKGIIKDSAFYTKRIDDFAKDDNIKALLLRIDSPGGLPGSSQAIFNELKKFKEKKPVVVLVENVCASAAYYVAVAANTIIANPSSIVGSIGAVMQVPNIEGLLTNWNVSVKLIQSGKFKTAGSMTKTMTPEEEAYLQGLANDTYKRFIDDVATARNLDKATQAQWADGKVFTGVQAKELKLIDIIGSHSDAVDELKKLANIEEDICFVTFRKRPSILMRLIMGDEDYGSELSEMSAKFLSRTYKAFLVEQSQCSLEMS